MQSVTTFGLADLFGVRLAGDTQGPMQNSYLRLEPDADKAATLLNGLEGTERIINGVYRVPGRSYESAPGVAAHAHPFLSGLADGGSVPA